MNPAASNPKNRFVSSSMTPSASALSYPAARRFTRPFPTYLPKSSSSVALYAGGQRGHTHTYDDTGTHHGIVLNALDSTIWLTSYRSVHL